MSAVEAQAAGLVSKVLPPDQLVGEAVKLGEKIAGFSKIAVAMAKEAVNAAANLSLDQGEGVRGGSANLNLDPGEGCSCFRCRER